MKGIQTKSGIGCGIDRTSLQCLGALHFSSNLQPRTDFIQDVKMTVAVSDFIATYGMLQLDWATMRKRHGGSHSRNVVLAVGKIES